MAGTNSGQFFNHKPTRSPGWTPSFSRSSWAIQRDCAHSWANVISASPQKIAVLAECCSTDAAKALARFISIRQSDEFVDLTGEREAKISPTPCEKIRVIR